VKFTPADLEWQCDKCDKWIPGNKAMHSFSFGMICTGCALEWIQENPIHARALGINEMQFLSESDNPCH